MKLWIFLPICCLPFLPLDALNVSGLEKLKITLPVSSDPFSCLQFERFCLQESQLFKHFYKTTFDEPIIPNKSRPPIWRIYPNLLHQLEFQFQNSTCSWFCISYLNEIGRHLYALNDQNEIKYFVLNSDATPILKLSTESQIYENYTEVQYTESPDLVDDGSNIGQAEIVPLEALLKGLLQQLPQDKLDWYGRRGVKLEEQFCKGESEFERQIWQEIQTNSTQLSISVQQYLTLNLHLENIACNTVVSPHFGIARNFELHFFLAKMLSPYVERVENENLSCVSFSMALGVHTCTRKDGLSICLNSRKDGKRVEDVESLEKPLTTGSLLIRQIMQELPMGTEEIEELLVYLSKYHVVVPFFWSIQMAGKCYVVQIDADGFIVNRVETFWIQGNFEVTAEMNQETVKRWNDLFPSQIFGLREALEFLQATLVEGSQLFTTTQYKKRLAFFGTPKEALKEVEE